MARPALASTLVNARPPEWVERVEMLDRRTRSAARLVREIVAAGRRGQTLILLGSAGFDARYADLLAAMALARLRRPPRIVITDATWEAGSAALAKRLPGDARSGPGLRGLANAAIRALDGPHVTYCVLSSAELATFPATWGIPADRVKFTPFCLTLEDEDLVLPRQVDGGVFAGGNPMRDYATLTAAAAGLGERVVVATSSIAAAERRRLPLNVEAGPLPHKRFVSELRRARVVAVPLRAGIERSAGQQTYLNAMALAKPVVVTDAPGVRDHVEPGVTGLIVAPGDRGAMRAALEQALDPREGPAMGLRAREAVLDRFSADSYLRSLLAVAGSA